MTKPTMPGSFSTPAQRWARAITAGSTDAGVQAVITALNTAARAGHLTKSDVVVACAQILGQSVANAGPECAAEMRAGIVSMVDGYAMQVAVEVDS